MNNNEQLIEDYAKFIYAELWPFPWESLADEYKERWRKQAKLQLSWLNGKGFVLMENKDGE